MLNQDVIWRPKDTDGDSMYGDFSYSTSQTIKCRKEPHIEEVKDSEGRVHLSKHIFYTRANVQVDDMLDGELVLKLYDMHMLGGKFYLRRLITI